MFSYVLTLGSRVRDAVLGASHWRSSLSSVLQCQIIYVGRLSDPQDACVKCQHCTVHTKSKTLGLWELQMRAACLWGYRDDGR